MPLETATTLIAGISFPTFPSITIGPLRIMTFGLFVAIGVLAGIYIAARRNERFGIPRSDTEKVGLILVGIGLLGARLLWVVTHLEEISSPVDVIAVWDGGLQFTGGFVTAILVAPLLTRRWPRGQRWNLLDGAVLGLAVGQAIGRIGCVAVGEHLGGPTTFFLGWTYTGGQVVEGPLVVGQTYHSAALYEILWLIPIILLLWYLDRRGARPGVMAATFAIAYGICRFATDFVRINDERVFGLTGAQYMCIALTLFGIGVLWWVTRGPAGQALAIAAAGESDGDASDGDPSDSDPSQRPEQGQVPEEGVDYDVAAHPQTPDGTEGR